MTKVEIPTGNQFLQGHLLTPTTPNGAGVLFVHGWTSNQSKYIPRAKSLVNQGFTCLTFDLRGHGASDGQLKLLSRQDHQNDVISAFKFLAKTPTVKANRIGLYGKSYGGYLSAILSSILKPKTIVLCAPALYPDSNFSSPTYQLIVNEPRIYQSANIPINQNQALTSLKKYQKPTLLIQLERDEEIPDSTIKTYLQLNQYNQCITHEIVPQSNHGLDQPDWNQTVINLFTSWFIEHL